MKTLLKSTITYGLILAGLLFSCKNNDGYSDKVQTNQNPSDSTQITVDSSATNNNGPANNSSPGNSGVKGAGHTGAESTTPTSTTPASTESGSTESGSTNSGNEAKGTGTGSGPGPSAKDGSAYSGPSDPQNSDIETSKKGAKKTTSK